MAATLQDLQDAITAISDAVDADAAQDQLVITAIEALLAKIATAPNAQDFSTQVAALSAAVTKMKGSNESIQTELDKANA